MQFFFACELVVVQEEDVGVMEHVALRVKTAFGDILVFALCAEYLAKCDKSVGK